MESLFIIKAILKPFSAAFHRAQGIFHHIFSVKKCALYLIKYGRFWTTPMKHQRIINNLLT
jgi:hypothetical protein